MADQLQVPQVNPEIQRMIDALTPEYLRRNTNVVDPNAQPGKIPAIEPMNFAPFLTADLVGNVAGAGAKAVGTGLKGAIFAGPMAANAPHKTYDLARAALLGSKKEPGVGTLMPGVNDSFFSRLWGKHGLSPGIEGGLRHEIQDYPLKVKPFGDKAEGKVGDLLDHPELFKAYPQLQDFYLRLAHGDHWGGYFNDSAKSLFAKAPNYDQGRQVLTHELQHAVQFLEGRHHGSNSKAMLKHQVPDEVKHQMPDEVWNKTVDDAHKLYQRDASEQEATNAMTRILGHQYMSPPWLTEETNRANQLIPHWWLKNQSPSTQAAFEPIENLAGQPGINYMTNYRLLLGK